METGRHGFVPAFVFHLIFTHFFLCGYLLSHTDTYGTLCKYNTAYTLSYLTNPGARLFLKRCWRWRTCFGTASINCWRVQDRFFGQGCPPCPRLTPTIIAVQPVIILFGPLELHFKISDRLQSILSTLRYYYLLPRTDSRTRSLHSFHAKTTITSSPAEHILNVFCALLQ